LFSSSSWGVFFVAADRTPVDRLPVRRDSLSAVAKSVVRAGFSRIGQLKSGTGPCQRRAIQEGTHFAPALVFSERRGGIGRFATSALKGRSDAAWFDRG
jgi:hypothetical protein